MPSPLYQPVRAALLPAVSKPAKDLLAALRSDDTITEISVSYDILKNWEPLYGLTFWCGEEGLWIEVPDTSFY